LWKNRVRKLFADSAVAYAIARGLLHDRQSAEDVVQESLVKILEKPPSGLRDEERARVYFLQVVRNQARKQNRSRLSRKRRERVLSDLPSDEAGSPESGVLSRETVRALRDSIARLPEEEREAVCLCCEAGLSQRVASEILCIRQSTVSYRLKKGLERLRGLLGKQGVTLASAPAVGEWVRTAGPPPAPALKARLEVLLRQFEATGAVPEWARTKGSSKAAPASSRASRRSARGSWMFAILAASAVVAVVAVGAVFLSQSEPLPRQNGATQAPEAEPAVAKVPKAVPHRIFETVYWDDFDAGPLDAFWTRRLPEKKTGHLRFFFEGSYLRIPVAAGAMDSELFLKGRKWRLHSRVELVSRPIELGQDGIMCISRWAPNRSAEGVFGTELLGAGQRPIVRVINGPGSNSLSYVIDGVRLAQAQKIKGVIVTPQGVIYTAGGLKGRSIVAAGLKGRDIVAPIVRKRLSSKLTSVRVRLFAEIPAESEKGGRCMAGWNRVGIHRVRLGLEKP
jgi:RNA polymerase sigma-70 factor (ECF subfamily)